MSRITISDGFDEGGIAHAKSIQAYLERFWQVGSQTLAELLEKLSSSSNLVDCIVYYQSNRGNQRNRENTEKTSGR